MTKTQAIFFTTACRSCYKVCWLYF